VLEQIPEIAPTGQSPIRPWPRPLVQRDPLGPRVCELSARAVRDLEPHANLDVAGPELCDRPIKAGHAVDQHGLISLKMSGQHQRRRIRGQAHHCHARPERLDREYHFRPQSAAECITSAATWRLGR
jgi:hypothetical protein